MQVYNDSFNLQRFIDAQESVYGNVLQELRNGAKRTHWMWFIFPQLLGLGRSERARRFAISGLAEASAYLAHPVLGVRLAECTQLVNEISDKSIQSIFGAPDDMKFLSCMTLFAHATPDNETFERALLKYFSGVHDPLTVEKIKASMHRK